MEAFSLLKYWRGGGAVYGTPFLIAPTLLILLKCAPLPPLHPPPQSLLPSPKMTTKTPTTTMPLSSTWSLPSLTKMKRPPPKPSSPVKTKIVRTTATRRPDGKTTTEMTSLMIALSLPSRAKTVLTTRI
ncbi:hypothetical protein PS2_013064 [Malus domestica]